MANWCYTKYVMFTDDEDKSELKRLYDNLAKAIAPPSKLENGFGSGWLGNVAFAHGLNWEDIPCRGTIEYLDDDYKATDNSFSFDTETAWCPCDELWQAIIEQYEDVDCVYMAEEPGMEIYVNTDAERDFFDERYLLEILGDVPIPKSWYADCPTKPSCLEEREYFSDFQELANYCAEITGRKFTTLVEIKDYFDNAFGADADVIATVHEFTPA